MQAIEFLTTQQLIAYPEAIKMMSNRVDLIINDQANELIWFLEHLPVYTAGTSAKEEELINKEILPVYVTGRGGKYTYHGPGQRIIYLMLDLRLRKQDLRWYIHQLEQLIINSLAKLAINAYRFEDKIGIWVIIDRVPFKIASIGIRVKKWVTFHGIAINIDPDLTYFNSIIPCGIKEYQMTSLAKLGKVISNDEFDLILTKELLKFFH